MDKALVSALRARGLDLLTAHEADMGETGSPSAKQPSVLGSGLNFSIHLFRSELRRPCRRTWGTLTPGYARLLRALLLSTFPISAFQKAPFNLWAFPFGNPLDSRSDLTDGTFPGKVRL
jgi:hypothetical protein